MGRMKNEDKDKLHNDAEKAKDLLKEIQATNGISVEDIINKVNEDNIPVPTIDNPAGNTALTTDYDEDEPDHVPINTLAEIKTKFAATKEVENKETGIKEMKPVYTEDDQLRMLMGLLSERGVNLLDYLEKVLQTSGYSGKVVYSINETLDKTTNILRDIADMQYKKQKLQNDAKNLQIQEYKANLKKEELELKRMIIENAANPTGDDVIAVATQAEILRVMNQGKTKEADVTLIESGDTEGE